VSRHEKTLMDARALRARSYVAGLMGELARRRNNERLGRPESRQPKLLSWGIGMCVGEVQGKSPLWVVTQNDIPESFQVSVSGFGLWGET
jgi:hypothetical protein